MIRVLVIPAQAAIPCCSRSSGKSGLDPGLRRDDER
jgi:hypothetical protein